MGKTSIEWTEHSINPFRATNKLNVAQGNDGKDEQPRHGHFCVKISDGCKNCYSSRMQPRFSTFEFVMKNRDKVSLWLDESKLLEVLHRRKPTTYFWCDMTDMFLEDYPDEWIDKCFATMALTPQHTHQVLTKRAERMYRYFATSNVIWEKPRTREPVHSKDRIDDVLNAASAIASDRISDLELLSIQDRWPLPNVHLGVSVEDQKTADERIPWLLKTPAAVRWVSYEPALGPVDFTALPSASGIGRCLDCLSNAGVDPGALIPSKLDWIVVGGESGPGARPFDIQWARDAIAQCKTAGVPCFVKQLGSIPMVNEEEWRQLDRMPLLAARDHNRVPAGIVPLAFADKKGGKIEEWPEDLRVREYPKGATRS